MNDRKTQFMQAVKILAPHDLFIHKAAQRIPAEQLPRYPGATALEFVVAAQRLHQPPQHHQFPTSQDEQTSCLRSSAPSKKLLSMKHALRIKGAECWLKLGKADQALWELERLPESTRKHPAALKARMAALGMLRENGQTAIQA